MKKLFVSLALLFAALVLKAQVTTIPAFVQQGYTGEITIVFNPNEGNKGMATATSCYAHTGITYDGKTWQKTGTWRDGASKYKMTKNEQGNWELKITPNMYVYYGVPETTNITQLSFVFNDGPNGSLEGKTAEGGDIFVDLVEPGLSAKILSPSGNQMLMAGETLTFDCATSEEADLTLTVGETIIASGKGSSLSATYTFTDAGDFSVVFTAKTAEETKTASVNVTVMAATIEKPRPEGMEMGVWYDETDDTRVTLCTYAASKTEPAKAVYVVGDFNNWETNSAYQMYRDGNFFWLPIENLVPGKAYQYQYWVVRADGQLKKISDAYAHSQVENNSVHYSVLQTARTPYPWSDATLNFKRPNKDNLIIYELWVYDFSPERNFAGLIRRLPYIQNLGVNAIELMPVCEFEGSYNWGYSPTHYFAPDRAYGSTEDFKHFIDECHKRGMAVIMDMVFNHATGLNPQNKLYPYGSDLNQNPWFNVTAPHSDNVYEDWNHDFPETRKMFTRALQYWLTEYKVDGYRMDLSHGFCGPDCNHLMDNLRHYYHEGVESVSPDAYFILEHWGSGMGTERPQLVEMGAMCWNNTSYAYSQLASANFSNESLTDVGQDSYVSYTESHDEERNYYLAKTSGVEAIRTDETLRLNRVPLTMGFNLLLDGPHMLFQYGELGYDYSINSTKGSSSIANANRTSKKEQPESLGWFTDELRMKQYQRVAQIIRLRTQLAPAVFEGNPRFTNLGSAQKLRYVLWGSGKDAIYVVGNFAATSVMSTVLPDGTWFDYFRGVQQTKGVITLQPGEIAIFTGRHYDLPVIPSSYDDWDALTNIEDIETDKSQSAHKVLENGQVVIYYNGSKYSVLGVKIK